MFLFRVWKLLVAFAAGLVGEATAAWFGLTVFFGVLIGGIMVGNKILRRNL
ncbi:hypothetical protein [Nocardia tengchongensis]|uniref:hypothetical protein n=1 Tax=Nocardia tengchongensis TaxID=2055889 RepID=UPI00368CC104